MSRFNTPNHCLTIPCFQSDGCGFASSFVGGTSSRQFRANCLILKVLEQTTHFPQNNVRKIDPSATIKRRATTRHPTNRGRKCLKSANEQVGNFLPANQPLERRTLSVRTFLPRLRQWEPKSAPLFVRSYRVFGHGVSARPLQ